MSNEVIKVYGTEKTLVSSGAAVSSGAISAASASSYGTNADGADYPHVLFVIHAAFGSNPTENTALGLYAQPLDIDGTNDAPAPTTTYKQRYIGAFALKAATDQYLSITAEDVPYLAAYYVINETTGQTLSSGWTLKATPYTYKAAA